MPRVFSLNAHARYACRHSGACCTAGWTIPVEPHKRHLFGTDWLVPDPDGACPQFDRKSHLCRVHRDRGEPSLPESCRHFPRRALVDGRGTFVALSHFCPTAATLLLEHDGPIDIVEDPPAFVRGEQHEGLDARTEWPPLLRPGVMFDDESFDMWERFLVRTFGSWPAGVPAALAYVAAAAERLRAWRVDAGPLVDVVTHALRVPPNSEADPRAAEHYAALVGSRCYTRVAATVPPELDAPVAPDDVDRSCSRWVEAGWCAGVRPPLRYLASKAFASWTAYQSRGVRTQVAELFVAATVLRVEAARVCARTQSPLTDAGWHAAIRAADLLLVHLADREGLMSWLGRAERDDHELDAP